MSAVKKEKETKIKKTTKKTVAKKTTAKKTIAKKPAVKKAPAKTTAKKSAPKKTAVKKAPTKKPAVKKVKAEIEKVEKIVKKPTITIDEAHVKNLEERLKQMEDSSQDTRKEVVVEEAKPEIPKEKIVKIADKPTVKELAEKLGVKPNDFMKKLIGMGIFATINQKLENDIVELVVEDAGYKLEKASEFEETELLGGIAGDISKMDTKKDIKHRPPVVTIMGHVDHGKTSLLDKIRSSKVAEGEAGAITQHIGAYKVQTDRGEIVFLDTPGHEAFTAMRARGAQVTDIVVLVVSAVDSIMPQTIEAIDHAKAAGAPIIVAVNKMDLPTANAEKVKQDLAQRGLAPEEWQGTTIFVEVSAKTGKNIDQLLEMIAMQAEIMELKADYGAQPIGVILESKLDKKRGIISTVLVKKGIMKIGQPFVVGTASGKIRALVNEHGKRMDSISPSNPAEVLGVNGIPPHVGDLFYVVESEKKSKHIADKRRHAAREDSLAHKKHVSLMDLQDGGLHKIKNLQIVLKGDVQGSLEAIKDTILKIPSEEVKIKIIHSGTGNINESDILLAKASDAIVIGFHVKAEDKATKEAEKEGIEIRYYNIIFELVEDIRAAMEGLLEPEVVEISTGKATIKQVFRLSSGIIAGSLVNEGKMTRGSKCKVHRGDEVVFTGRVGGLKRFKEDVKEVDKNIECGILVDGYKQIKDGDVVECYKEEQRTRRIEKS